MLRAGALLCALAGFLQVFPAAAVEKTAGIKLLYSEGRTLIQRNGSQGWVAADSNDFVTPGYKIRTEHGSRAEFELPGKTILRLGQSSGFSFADSSRATPADSLKTLGELVGDFWISGFGSPEGLTCRIECPLKEGTIIISSENSISPTIFRMAVGRDGTVELKAYQGLARVEFTGLDSLVDSSNAVNFPHLAAPEAAGKLAAVTVQSQEKLLLTSSGKIVYEGPFSATDIDEETSWVEWNKARDAELH